MSFLDFLYTPGWERLALTLLHFLWQGTAVLVLLACVLKLFRLKDALSRYTLCLVAFLGMALLPLVTFFLVDVGEVPPPGKNIRFAEFRSFSGPGALHPSPLSVPADTKVSYEVKAPVTGEAGSAVSVPAEEAGELQVLAWRFRNLASSLQPFFLFGWALGVLVRLRWTVFSKLALVVF